MRLLPVLSPENHLVLKELNMQDKAKTKEQLLTELYELRRRVDELEQERMENKQAEEALRASEARVKHLNNVLRAMRDVSGLLNREKDPLKLLTDVCNSLAQTRGYVMAWIGQPEAFSKRVLPVTHSGVGSEFLEHSLITWDDSPTGQGPAGTAIRERRAVVFEDIANDPRFVPWKESVVAYGGASIASVPLIHREHVFGVLTVKADRPDAFDAEEVDLLSGLAADIARVLQGLEDERVRKQTEDALRQSEEDLRFLSSKLLSAQEDERKNIAGELHDSFGSSLAAIMLGLENARAQLNQSGSRPELLDSTIAWTKLLINEVRRLTTELRPPFLDNMGVVAALQWFFRQYRTTYPGIHVEVEVGIEEQDIPDPLRIVIFRIAQEAFHNIAKYSNAEYVDFSLIKQDSAIHLTIEDNGEGFDLEAALPKISERQGLGITGMKERAELSRGSFMIQSVQGTGTVLRVMWPLSTPRSSGVNSI
jgi:signal transduction histidine kinase